MKFALKISNSLKLVPVHNSHTRECNRSASNISFFLNSQSDVRWLERYRGDVDGLAVRLKDLYSRYATYTCGIQGLINQHFNILSPPTLSPSHRLVEKMHDRQMTINRASSSVTEKIFVQQCRVKQAFLDEISLAGREERDSLSFWRKLILHNTHPRLD